MKAIYHQDATTKITLDVLEKPKGGKADLGRSKEVLISDCPISKDGAPGTCTLIKDDGDAKAEAAEKAAAEKAAEEAAAKKAAEPPK